MTPEDKQLAQAALMSHYLSHSLDGNTFLELSEVLSTEPDEFWQRYFEHFNPPSELANAIVKRLAEEAAAELESMVIRTKDHSSKNLEQGDK